MCQKEELQQDLQNDISSYLYIRFYLDADSIDIQTFSRLIGISPTDTSVENNSFAYWRYETEQVSIYDISKIMEPILTKLEENAESIVKYTSTLDKVILGMCVNIFYIEDEPLNINISRKTIELLSKVNCMLQFDVI